jgi:hypothetical protein
VGEGGSGVDEREGPRVVNGETSGTRPAPTSKGRSKASPLNVKGVTLGVSTADLVAVVREGRERG